MNHLLVAVVSLLVLTFIALVLIGTETWQVIANYLAANAGLDRVWFTSNLWIFKILGHIAFSFMIGLSVLMWLKNHTRRALLFLIMFAGVTELIQLLSPTRQVGVLDFCFNLIGIGCAWLLFRWLHKTQHILNT